MANKVMLGLCPTCRKWSDFKAVETDMPLGEWVSVCCNGTKSLDYLEEVILDDDDEIYSNTMWAQ